MKTTPLTPLRPRVLVLMLTERCNFSCTFCEYRADGGEMPFAAACRVAGEAKELGAQVAVLTGGEPLIYGSLYDLVAFCKDRHLGVNITTNGWLVEREARRIASSGVDSISFSLDGLPGTHDRLRGRRGAAEAVARGMDALAKARPGLVVNVNFVVTRENVFDLPAVAAAAKARGAAFNFWPVNNVKALNLRPGAEADAYLAFIEAHVRGDPVLGPRYEFYHAALDYHVKGGMRVRCLGAAESLNVNWNGDLLPCCLWEDKALVLGNAFARPLSEILADPATAVVHARIRDQGCLDRCYNHALHEFTARTGLPFVVG